MVSGGSQRESTLTRSYEERLMGSPTYYERFREAFVTEVNEFTACVLDDKREYWRSWRELFADMQHCLSARWMLWRLQRSLRH